MEYSDDAPRKKRHYLRWLFLIIVVVGAYNVFKPLPAGVSVKGNIHLVPESSVKFLTDQTYVDATGERKSEQTIFDEVFKMIDGANEYILIDMFLWNSWKGSGSESHRGLSDELTSALVEKKKANPDISITVISDPINTVYGGNESVHYKNLRNAGIPVIETNLSRLRDSNPIYSAFWRTLVSWWTPLHELVTGKEYTFRKVPNPFAANGTPVTIRSYLSLLNFKANHRKLIVTDFIGEGGERKMATLVASANPHDASSAHTNIALRVDDFLWRSTIESERAVATFSDTHISLPENADAIMNETGEVKVRLLTEGTIRDEALRMIESTNEGDAIDMHMFYLSERSIVEALIAAAGRSVTVRLILDPNKDAFGHEKNGVPNRPTAAELLDDSDGKIQIRWCDTHGEQCHSKLLLVRAGDTHSLLLGSANFTRRNIGNYNLETNVWAEANREFTAFTDAKNYFEAIWTNTDGKIFTTDYETYKDETLRYYILYRVMEALGTSSF